MTKRGGTVAVTVPPRSCSYGVGPIRRSGRLPPAAAGGGSSTGATGWSEQFDYFGLPAPNAPVNVKAVTGTFTQFCAVVVGLNATSPATRSPGLRFGSVLDDTLPLIAWCAVRPVVFTAAVVVPPVLHRMVAVRVRLPLAQLAVV